MGRFRGDNGKPDDTAIKDLISPFRVDRSAFVDGIKLAESGFQCRRVVLVYGFDDAERPLREALDALDLLLRSKVDASERPGGSISRPPPPRAPIRDRGSMEGTRAASPRRGIAAVGNYARSCASRRLLNSANRLQHQPGGSKRRPAGSARNSASTSSRKAGCSPRPQRPCSGGFGYEARARA